MDNTFEGKSKEDIQILLSGLKSELNPTIARRIIGLLDFTSLKITDSNKSIEALCEKVNNYQFSFPDLPIFGGFCVYPRFVRVLKKSLEIPTINIVAAAAGFPTGNISAEVKIEDVKRSLDDGADEIDIVMPLGEFLDGNHSPIRDEISSIKEIMGSRDLKVIIESGSLNEPGLIYDASILALESGADFIKTSTGKEKISASLEAVYIMCNAIKNYYHAGGIRTAEDAANYYSLVEMLLGSQWLLPEYFRIGASSLANNLLTEVEGREINYF